MGAAIYLSFCDDSFFGITILVRAHPEDLDLGQDLVDGMSEGSVCASESTTSRNFDRGLVRVHPEDSVTHNGLGRDSMHATTGRVHRH